jgi:hypothetical protein
MAQTCTSRAYQPVRGFNTRGVIPQCPRRFHTRELAVCTITSRPTSGAGCDLHSTRSRKWSGIGADGAWRTTGTAVLPSSAGLGHASGQAGHCDCGHQRQRHPLRKTAEARTTMTVTNVDCRAWSSNGPSPHHTGHTPVPTKHDRDKVLGYHLP